MSLPTLQLLSSNAQDFVQTAVDIEEKIVDLRLKDNSFDFVPDMHGRRHHDMWTSLKTVSHFNLGVALELMFKYVLLLGKIEYEKGHKLTPLYHRIPEDARINIDTYYEKCLQTHQHGVLLIAFVDTPNPSESEQPFKKSVETLEDLLRYLDEELKIWDKRYSWEYIDKQKWRHYIDNIEPIRIFIQLVLTLGNRAVTKNPDTYSRSSDSS